jgi:hypothetical protein
MTQVRLSRQGGALRVSAPRYRLTTQQDRPFVTLSAPDGAEIAELFIPSSVHAAAGQDDTPAIGAWDAREDGGAVTLSVAAASTVWRAKRYELRCEPERITYTITVEGEGELAHVHYFGGYYSATVRWGSGFFPSGQRFRRCFTPEPNTHEQPFFGPAEGAAIDLMGVPLPGRGDWFFTPPPFCFAAEHAGGWLALGVEPAPGQHGFTGYHYDGRCDAFHLTLTYEGQTRVSGVTTLPALGIAFADDPYAALDAHCAAARAAAPPPDDLPDRQPAPWWGQPIFCGWGAQCHLAARAQGRAPDYARQEHYDGFLAVLEAEGLDPGTVVLDDKWQATYGDNAVDRAKWPDLSGFVARQHVLGRKVLLWLKLWDPEGVPADECVTNAAGLPIAVDPSNPRFERRLRAAVRRMLGPDGYDADGFKLDFSARIPSGPGLRRHGQEWGLELLRRYLWVLADEARRVKPDALVMAHTPHPYLANVVDMVRLNDVNRGKDIVAAMSHRARVARIACPAALIDTDNWPCTDRASWRAYLEVQPSLGVPSLYYVDHIDSTGEPLQPADYALLRERWNSYGGGAEARRARRLVGLAPVEG